MRGVARKENFIASTWDTLTSTQVSLFAVQRYIYVMSLENAYLDQHLAECSTTSVTTVSESFENSL